MFQIAIIVVDRNTAGGINGAIEKSNEGDVILVKNGRYADFTLTKDYLTLVAEGNVSDIGFDNNIFDNTIPHNHDEELSKYEDIDKYEKD